MTARSFQGLTVVVTGGAGGIGRALGARFLRAGARVALLDLDGAAVAGVAAELSRAGAEIIGVACDVTVPADCTRALDAVRARLGPVDVLVANAGIAHRSAFCDTELAVFRRVMEVNFFGALHATQAALADLRARRGLCIVISSIAGVAPLYGRSGYAASTHALHGLFDTARTELAADGVGVLIVCPSFTRSGFEASALGARGERTGRPRSSVGAVASPESVADAVVAAAARGRRLLVLSPVGKTSYLLSRLAPRLYERLMLRSLRSELSGG
ncbi:MAG: SDR family oxidoreductase [Polyangiaceae bacterium]|nr:SDR family oxidoreductase [Polyangiaceae bacterium]